MPGSIPNPILYLPAKVIAYSLAGWVLKKVYREGPNPFLFGFLRVVFGLAVGIPLLIFAATTMSDGGYIWLVATRLVVWAAMIWAFYERKNFSTPRFLVVVLSGILLSFGIDLAFSWVSDEFPGMLSVGMC